MLTPSRSAHARWALAAVLLLAGLGRDYESWVADAFVNFVLFIGALILVALEAVPWVAERLSLPIVEVYFPNFSFPKPPLSYALARRYRDERRLEDAAEQYQKIIRYYPYEETAYVELIKLAEQMEDRRLGDRYAELYQRRFRQDVLVVPSK
jgi:hypothetical protein